MDDLTKLKSLIAMMFILSIFFLVYNLALSSSNSFIGRAFYIGDRGVPSMRDPASKELPPDMASINVILWGISTVIMLILLLTFRHFAREHMKKTRKKVKK